ncbi:MAG: hypothetical protein ACO2O2_08400 [Acidilobaceae archaeon]
MNVRELVEVELAKQGVSGYKLEWYHDPDWGYVYIVEVGLNARRALELNLKLQEMLPGIPVVVKWIGETDVSKSELADYLLKIMARGGFKARAPPGFDAVEAVREVRGDR